MQLDVVRIEPATSDLEGAVEQETSQPGVSVVWSDHEVAEVGHVVWARGWVGETEHATGIRRATIEVGEVGLRIRCGECSTQLIAVDRPGGWAGPSDRRFPVFEPGHEQRQVLVAEPSQGQRP